MTAAALADVSIAAAPASLRDAAAPVDAAVVVRLGDALERRVGLAAGAHVYRRADLLALWLEPPSSPVDAGAAARLASATLDVLPRAQARAILADAARAAADDFAATRLTWSGRRAFRLAPRAAGARLLSWLIARRDWAQTGGAAARVDHGGADRGAGLAIEIADGPFETPDGLWRAELLERLFRRLVSDDRRVVPKRIHRDGRPGRRYEIVTRP